MTEAVCEIPQSDEPEPVDLFTLLAQFTALRHEVNLQTRASRTAVEQNAEVLKRLAEATKPPDTTETLRPLVKALIDVADALSTAVKQLERSKVRFEPLLKSAGESAFPALPGTPAVAKKPGFFSRVFGSSEAAWDRWRREAEAAQQGQARRASETAEALLPLVSGIADGYTLSLRRVERAIAQAGVEAIECEGRPFDPDLMEVVEAVDGDGLPSGTVVEEARRGYRWQGTVLRFAQVKVAR